MAIVAGVAGAGLWPFVIAALGIAKFLADGFSMATVNYSGTKAELDNARRWRDVEELQIREHPEGERFELREILAKSDLSCAVSEEATEAITQNREN